MIDVPNVLTTRVERVIDAFLRYIAPVSGIVIGVALLIVYVIVRTHSASENQMLGWLLLIAILSALAQTIVELRLWWTMRKRRDHTPVGVGLRAKWLTLGESKFSSALLNTTLFVLFVLDRPLASTTYTLILAAFAVTCALAAICGLILLSRLHREERTMI